MHHRDAKSIERKRIWIDGSPRSVGGSVPTSGTDKGTREISALVQKDSFGMVPPVKGARGLDVALLQRSRIRKRLKIPPAPLNKRRI